MRKILILVMILSLVLGVAGCDQKRPEGIRQEMYDEAIIVLKIIENNFDNPVDISSNNKEIISNFLSKYQNLDSSNELTYKERFIYENLSQASIISVQIHINKLINNDKFDFTKFQETYDNCIKTAKEVLEIK